MSYRSREASESGAVTGFLLGALIGMALAVLYAPKPGAETRKEMSVKLAGAQDNVSGVLAQAATCLRGRAAIARQVLGTCWTACCAQTATSAQALRRESGLQ
jgi:gas vesicle protein